MRKDIEVSEIEEPRESGKKAMEKKYETKICLVDEAENVVFPLEPFRYGYIIPEEFQAGNFILNEDDIYMVKPVKFEVEDN